MAFRIIDTLFLLWLLSFSLPAQNAGCTDPLATNYDPSAVKNDGSCIYPPAQVDVINAWVLPAVIPETSGLISLNQKIWTHNDDTDTNLYALDTNDINNYDAVPLTGVANIDWEELAQDSGFVYLGDFGNNAGNRTDLKILKIDKTSLLNQQPVIDTIAFYYEDQTVFNPGPAGTDYDCEAMIVSKDSIFLFTKQWNSKGTKLYALSKIPGNHKAKLRDSLNVEGLVTAATWIASQDLIILTGYQNYQPFLYLLYDYKNLEFFSGNKRKISINAGFHQVEGITTLNGTNVIISNEEVSQPPVILHAKLQQLDLNPYLSGYLTSATRADYNNTSIGVYPNPASQFLYIEIPANKTGINYSISGIIGQRIIQGKLNKIKNCIPVNTLDTGLYILSIGDPEYYSEKIIIR